MNFVFLFSNRSYTVGLLASFCRPVTKLCKYRVASFCLEGRRRGISLRRFRTAMKQRRVFQTADSTIWNDFPLNHAHQRDLSGSFFGLLKTSLFARAWAGNASEQFS